MQMQKRLTAWIWHQKLQSWNVRLWDFLAKEYQRKTGAQNVGEIDTFAHKSCTYNDGEIDLFCCSCTLHSKVSASMLKTFKRKTFSYRLHFTRWCKPSLYTHLRNLSLSQNTHFHFTLTHIHKHTFSFSLRKHYNTHTHTHQYFLSETQNTSLCKP